LGTGFAAWWHPSTALPGVFLPYPPPHLAIIAELRHLLIRHPNLNQFIFIVVGKTA
jgi:hypothetical protein